MKGSEVQKHMGEIYKDPPQSRGEAILRATIDSTDYNDPPQSRVEDLLIELKETIEAGGGGGGTSTIAWKPTVAPDGTITWTRTASETAPAPQNIMGDDGVGIAYVTVNASNHLIVTKTDGTTEDAGEIDVSLPIDDTTPASDKVYSSEKVTNLISQDIDGVIPVKNYTLITPTIYQKKVVRYNSTELIDNTFYNVAEIPVRFGEVYKIVGTTNSTAALCLVVDENDNILFVYPTSAKQNNLVLTEGIEVTIPEGGVKMYSSVSRTNTYIHSIYKVTDSGKYTIITKSDVLYNKKWYALGDSFTFGYFNDYTDSQGRTGQFSDAFDDIQGCFKTYPWYIQQRCGIKANTTLSMGGIDFTNVSEANQPFSASSSPRNYTMIPNDCDYITIAFGLNEVALTSEQIGTKEDTTNETLWGAYSVVLTSILTNNPKVKIGIIISDAWMSQTYHDALIDIAKYWGVPYLDLKDGEQVPMMLDGELREHSSVAESLRDSVFQISSNSHPTLEAHRYRSTVIENFLRSL